MEYRELGKVVAEFIPSKEKKNPRNSEGAFLSLKNGQVLFVYSRFKGAGCEDWGVSDICAAPSSDGGRSFGQERTLLTCEGEKSVNIMSLSLMEMADGDIGLFYLARHTHTMMQMYLRRSADNGQTWSERVLCTPQEGFFVVNNDRVVRLSSGRILIPAACHRAGRLGEKKSRYPARTDGEARESGYQARADIEAKESCYPDVADTEVKENCCQARTDGEAEESRYLDSRSEAVFFYSDDDGATWRAADGKCCMPAMRNCLSGLQEPGVLELSPGILWGFARTDLGRQYEMYSLDNGNTWTGAEPSRFTAPNSPLSMKRDRNGDIWAVWNPIPEYNGRGKTEVFTGGRTPYVIAVSRDNGKTFSEGTAFEREEDHGYCYCAMHFLDDALLLGYNAGGPEDGSCLARTRIRRIGREQLETLG